MPFQFPGSFRKTRSGANMKRENLNNRPPKTSPIRINSATKSGSVLTVEYNQALVPPKGQVPQYTLTGVPAAVPLSAEMVDPMTVEITFSAAITAATAIVIPYEDPAIRNSIGGFVADSTFPLAA